MKILSSSPATYHLAEITIETPPVSFKRLVDEDAVLFIQKSSVYIGKSQWTFKGKAIAHVETSHEDLGCTVTLTDGRKFVFYAKALPLFDKLVARLDSMASKAASKGTTQQREQQPPAPITQLKPRRRRRETFGHAPRRKLSKERAMPWDDVDQDEIETTGEGGSASVSTKAELGERGDKENTRNLARADTSTNEAEEASSDEELFDDEDPLPKKRVSNAVVSTEKKERLNKRKVLYDSDDQQDDNEEPAKDSLFGPKLTTPAAKVMVSPSANVSIATETEEEESDATDAHRQLEKGQSTLAAFFTHTAESKPAVAKPPPPTTPVRQNNTAALTPARSQTRSRPKKRHPEYHWLQSPSAVSPKKKRQQERLFGNNSFTHSNDPIKDDFKQEPAQSTTPRATLQFTANSTPHSGQLSKLQPGRTIHKGGKRHFGLGPSKTIRHSPLPTTPAWRKNTLSTLMAEEPRTNPFRGLRNLGNTCYMNASLQMLCTLENTVREIKKVAQDRGGNLANSVVDIAEQLGVKPSEATNGSAVNPKAVKDAMDEKTDKFRGFEQRDAHEFLSDLVDNIHEELELGDDKQAVPQGEHQKDTGKGSPMDDFLLTVQVCLTCQTCGYSRSKEETYRHLSIDIVTEEASGDSESSLSQSPKAPPHASLDKSLARFFQSEVREVKCEKCEDGTHASQTMKVVHRPKALLLHLKRFIFVEKPVPKDPAATSDDTENQTPNSPSSKKESTPVEYVFQKNKARVGIAESLSLDPFHAEGLKADSSAYKLKSIVHHIGKRASSGHYTADAVRLVEKNDQSPSESESTAVAEPAASMMNVKTRAENGWVSFDDGISSLTTLEKITGNRNKQSTAYMMLYTLQAQSSQD